MYSSINHSLLSNSIRLIVLILSTFVFVLPLIQCQHVELQSPSSNINLNVSRNHLILASSTVRPGQTYRVTVTVLSGHNQVHVRASIKRFEVELSSTQHTLQPNTPETLLLQVPGTSLPGDYRLRVQGYAIDQPGSNEFLYERVLHFEQRALSILIHTDRPVYHQSQTIHFRCAPLTSDLHSFGDSLDVHLLDARGNLVRRWLSRQSNHGAVSLYHNLSDQPAFGRWRIDVIAQSQKESAYFLVEEYRPTRFEVAVQLPALVPLHSKTVHGSVQANFTSGLLVTGNLTLHALITCGADRPPSQPDQWAHLRTWSTSMPIFTGMHNFQIPLEQLPLLAGQPVPQAGCVLNVQAQVGERFLNLIYSGYSSALLTAGQLRLSYLGGGAQLFQPQMPFRMHCAVSYADGSAIEPEVLAKGNLTLLTRVHLNDGRALDLPARQLQSAGQLTMALFKEDTTNNRIRWQPQIDASIIDEQNGRTQPDDVFQTEIRLRDELSTLDQLLSVNRLHLEARYSNDRLEQSVTAIADVFAVHTGSGGRALHVSTSTVRPQVGQYLVVHVRANYPIQLLQYAVMSKQMLLHSGFERTKSHVHTFDVALSAEMAPAITVVVFDSSSDGELLVDAMHVPVHLAESSFELQVNQRKDKSGESIELTVRGEPGAFVGLAAFDQHLLRQFPYASMLNEHVLARLHSFEQPGDGGKIYRWLDRDTGSIKRTLRLPVSGIGVDANRTFTNAGLLVMTNRPLYKRSESCSSDADTFVCLDGSKCMTKDKKCDRRRDCADGSDESDCDFAPIEWPFAWTQHIQYTDEPISIRSANQLTSYKFKPSLSSLSTYQDVDTSIKSNVRLHWSDAIVPVNRESRTLRLYQGSWLWKDLHIGPLGYTTIRISVPNWPADWQLNAFAIGARSGLALLNKPVAYNSKKRFRMQLEAPEVCVIGEQLALRVSLFNAQPSEIEVLLSLVGSDDYRFVHVGPYGTVSAHSPRTSAGEHQHLLLLKPESAIQVHLPIVATRLGTITVRVRARTQSAQYETNRELQVQADGVPQFLHSVALVDLSQGAQVIKYMHTNLTDTPVIPFQRIRRYVYGSNRASVSLVGDVLGLPLDQLPLDARNLLRLPHAPAEQSMFNFAVNLYTLLYLRLSGQRNAQIEKPVFAQLHVMYERQLSFQRPDGAFRQFRWSQTPSVWLTAFCARILHKANFQEWEQLLNVEKRVIEKSIDWLLNQQAADGSFQETTAHAFDRKMSSDLEDNLFNRSPSSSSVTRSNVIWGSFWPSSQASSTPTRPAIDGPYSQKGNVSLTAHVAITLAQVRDLSGELGARVATARWAAQRYLEAALHAVKQRPHPYELAIVTYALTLLNSVHAGDGFNALDERMREVRGMRYWAAEPVPAPAVQMESSRPYLLPRRAHAYQALDVEATAYALLVHIQKQAVIQQEIVDWLNTYRTDHCAWSSTQDSLIALQALFEFSLRSRARELTNIDLQIQAPAAGNLSFAAKLSAANLPYMQRFELPHAYGPVLVRASGAGLALVQMHVQYNVDWAHLQLPPPLPAFSLHVLMHAYGRNASHLQFTSCQRWTAVQESRASGQAVLAITVPTGYFVHQHSLDQYVRTGYVRNLRDAKFAERLVEFYFDYLDQEDICVSFTVQRWHPVANMTRFIYARVYDYYSPERFNETMINAYNLHVLSICHVCGSYQCPYCPAYSAAINLQISTILTVLVTLITFRYIQMQ